MNRGKYLDIKDLRYFSNINELKSVTNITLEWIGIFGTIFLCEIYSFWLLYFLSIIWIGARMHALGILGHDGTHYLLFKHKKINDWTTKLLLFWPLHISLKQYRKIHFAHHKYLKTDQDPENANLLGYEEFTFPKTKKSLYWILVKDILGINFLYYQYKSLKIKGLQNYLKQYIYSFFNNLIQSIYYIAIFSMLILTSHLGDFFWYWLVPMHTWLAFCTRLRVIGEHEALPQNALEETRNLVASPLEKMLLVPHDHAMHLTHHLYPSIPTYRLKKCHQNLLKSKIYENNAHITYGYIQLIRECIKNI